MQLVLLYRPKSEYARQVEEYAEEFKRLHPEYDVVLRDVDTNEGSNQAQLYDIMNYPALLAIADNGNLLNMWLGDNLPLMQEVSSYLMS